MRLATAIVGAACSAVLLAACATTPRPAAPSAPVSIEGLERWQARGRIGVSGPDGGGSGSFEWQQQDDIAAIQIRGPAGIGSVRLKLEGAGDQPNLELQTGDGETLSSDAAWAELEARLGARLPAGNLRYWLLGLAAPGAHEWRSPAADGSVTLEQQGWQIEYQRYSDEWGAKVPMRLRASSGEARVRIVVDRWQLGQ